MILENSEKRRKKEWKEGRKEARKEGREKSFLNVNMISLDVFIVTNMYDIEDP